MGAVKQHFHEEICAMHNGQDEPDPDELEMLAMDAQLARERYQDALKKREAEKNHD